MTLKQLLLLNIASPATIRRHLGRLVSDGLIERRPSNHDRRKVHLALSGEAMNIFDQLYKELVGVFKSQSRGD